MWSRVPSRALFFSMWIASVDQLYLLLRTTLFLLHYSAVLVITKRLYMWRSVSGFSLLFHLFCPSHHSIVITGFLMNFDTWWYDSSDLAFLQGCRGLSWSFVFPYKAENHLLSFYQASKQANKIDRDFHCNLIWCLSSEYWVFQPMTVAFFSSQANTLLVEAVSNSEIILL